MRTAKPRKLISTLQKRPNPKTQEGTFGVVSRMDADLAEPVVAAGSTEGMEMGCALVQL